MVRVRCNCGTTLSAPSSIRAARCPRCSSIVYLTPKITQAQNQVPAGSQYYNYWPAQTINGYQRPSPELSNVPSINGYQHPSSQLSHVPTGNGYQQPSPQLSHVPTTNGYQRPSPQLSHAPSIRKTKRAVLIGISYNGTPNSVKGSLNDVKMMNYFLTTRFGFAQSSVLTLTEQEREPNRIPTKQNIQAALNWLVKGCQEGDSLVFFYSGHGARTGDSNGDERDGFDEALCPVDYKTAGKILDDEINETIVRPLPYGVKLHAVIDTCRSGTLLDLPFTCTINQQGYYEWEDQRTSPTDKGTSGGIAICFSACDDHETSLDFQASPNDVATGAMTYSFIQAVQEGGRMTYGDLLQSIRAKIRETEKRLHGPNVVPPKPQVPQLTSSGKFDIHRKPFTL